ncbi:MAG TPA: hypothetical protein VFS44_15550 [Gemmatimonadaceae bacterium]|nr:hypothetical protein [Gemmatimonadaceae bacterium]
MISSTPGERLADDRDRMERQPFLATHRALAVCTRELGRLCDEVVQGAQALHGTSAGELLEVRQSPGRCIVQFGPVALTVAWLRSTLDTVADGELLAIVWRGTVAPRRVPLPERSPASQAPRAATALWEEVLTAVATDEESWRWQSGNAIAESRSSTELAAQFVARLGAAHAECQPM